MMSLSVATLPLATSTKPAPSSSRGASSGPPNCPRCYIGTVRARACNMVSGSVLVWLRANASSVETPRFRSRESGPRWPLWTPRAGTTRRQPAMNRRKTLGLACGRWQDRKRRATVFATALAAAMSASCRARILDRLPHGSYRARRRAAGTIGRQPALIFGDHRPDQVRRGYVCHWLWALCIAPVVAIEGEAHPSARARRASAPLATPTENAPPVNLRETAFLASLSKGAPAFRGCQQRARASLTTRRIGNAPPLNLY
jgi:hypothetical protein